MVGRALAARAYLFLWLLLFAAAPAFCLDPDKPLSQYNHYAWRVTDGTFRSAPTSLAQTSDGYIWDRDPIWYVPIRRCTFCFVHRLGS